MYHIKEHVSTPSKINYYDILNVDKEASDQEIKASYQKKAKLHHPDHNLGREKESADHFSKILEAYRTLSDPKLRAMYDRSEILKPHIISATSKSEIEKLFKENGVTDPMIIPSFPKSHSVEINEELINNIKNATFGQNFGQINNDEKLNFGISSPPFKSQRSKSPISSKSNSKHLPKDEKILKDFIDLVNSSVPRHHHNHHTTAHNHNNHNNNNHINHSNSHGLNNENTKINVNNINQNILNFNPGSTNNNIINNNNNSHPNNTFNTIKDHNLDNINNNNNNIDSREKNNPINFDSSIYREMTLQTTINVSFDESVRGCTKHILFKRQVLCNQCCSKNSDENVITIDDDYKECIKCGSKGVIIEDAKLIVNVPAGIPNGWKKVINGEGDVSKTAKGDLIIIFNVEKHPFFRRSGHCDVTCELPISFPQAVLGVSLKIPSLYGPIRVCYFYSTFINYVLNI